MTQPVAVPATPGAMRELMLTFAISLAVLLAGLVAVFRATEGGSAYTTETLRRSAVAKAPALVPDLQVVNAAGQGYTLRELLAQPLPVQPAVQPAAQPAAEPTHQPTGKVWIVDFVYTRCQTLCLSLGTVFQQLQSQIVAQGLQQQVGLLSISFDPAHDRPPELADYARRMQMNSNVWQAVSLQRPADRRRLLDSFGIMVVPAPLGEFEHNAALHVVAPDGKLMRILGLAEGADALALAVALKDQLSGAQQTAQARP